MRSHDTTPGTGDPVAAASSATAAAASSGEANPSDQLFNDVVIGNVRFKPKASQETRHQVTDTVVLQIGHQETQTIKYTSDNSCQSEPVKMASLQQEPQEQSKVKEFLDKIGPLVLQQMAVHAASTTQRAFDDFERLLEQAEDTDISKMFTLSFDFDTYFMNPPKATDTNASSNATNLASAGGTTDMSLRLSCTGLSWNATGSVIAVAYGRFDHSGWCNYRSALCLWRVFQSDFNPLRPNLVLEASSGLMCVAFHPKFPSIVAAGSFNGEVFVWDTEPDEYKFYSSGIGDYFHREPITKVAWVYDVLTGDYNISSISGDGKILFWRLKDRLAYPIEGYLMHAPTSSAGNNVNATTSSTLLKSKAIMKHQLIGGKTFGFCPNDKSMTRSFVMGSEAGLVSRCLSRNIEPRASDFKGDKKWSSTAARIVCKMPNLAQQQLAKQQIEKVCGNNSKKEVALASVYEAQLDVQQLFPNAMDFLFDKHDGPVFDCQFNNFRKDLFATCSADGTVRVYQIAQKEPLLKIEVSSSYLYTVKWSRTRPMVFAVGTEDGGVYLYDLKVDRIDPVVVLNVRENRTKSNSTPSNPTKKNNNSSSSSSTSSSASAATSAVSASVFALDFNPRQRNFLATGDSVGKVHVWKLNWRLANLQTGETSLIETFDAI